ncbi:hypothetical protein TraAM80_00795 [Trypanosoma rangeli]|uniref:Uncharacterized protein n=1 Tax=Trypanosoma rangeli TaxID=5698 RepID=A0A3R7KQG6_TRYRA|nr:uncharacterized protein TraAM80_00795 [Trypanosoma rangeli]RNF11603.1 hypothetical protein TraAM80_00795 [Trypanosoma rangeli]|eukprot:RNF11603.1 hypothetical protein TraAM80_00795 [Trypanosoma rangeli]
MSPSPSANSTLLAGSKNLSVAVEGSKLFIYSDLSQDFGVSSSGKSLIIASSSGNKPLGATNAFLGLNLYCKSAEKRMLTKDATSELHEMTAMGNYCEWRIEGQTLCIMIDFNNVGDKVATTGKSVLLASSGGNKAVGKTGIMCGLNCYVPLGKEFCIEKLSTVVERSTVAVGDAVNVGDGFVVEVESRTQVTVHCESEKPKAGVVIAMPPFTLNGEVTLAMMVKWVDKKRRTQGGSSEHTEEGFVAVSSKWKNILLRRGVVKKGEDGGGNIDLHLRFDPTQSFGRSTSGKSMTVATSAGWSDVGDGIFISFNAYRPAPQLAHAEIKDAVQKVLGQRSKEELSSLSFKTIKGEVEAVLGLKENDLGDLQKQVKEAVAEHMESLVSSDQFMLIKTAVDEVLGGRSREEVATLSLKTVVAEVSSALGTAHGELEDIKEHVKAAVIMYLRRNVK